MRGGHGAADTGATLQERELRKEAAAGSPLLASLGASARRLSPDPVARDAAEPTTKGEATQTRGAGGIDGPRALTAFALVAFGLLAAPTLYAIARASWTDEQSQQGPIVLAIGAWLLWRRWPSMREAGAPGAWPIALAGAGAFALLYVAGRVSALFLAEAYAVYGLGLCAVYALVGARGLREGLFPLVFLAFAIPTPFAVAWPVTVHLRLWISEATVQLLHLFGVNAARDGLTLFIESYRIEIAEACSGMNSLLALTALGLCFVHIRRDPPFAYYAAMLPVIIGFAIVANFVRVIALAVMTLTLGDATAQGVLHETLGFVTFGVALGLTFAADAGLARTWRDPSQLKGTLA